MDLGRKMSLTGQGDQIKQQACYGKDEGDGLSRIQRNVDVGNQYEADYQRLTEFADTTNCSYQHVCSGTMQKWCNSDI